MATENWIDEWCKKKDFTTWVLPNMGKAIWLENFIADWMAAKIAPGTKWFGNVGHTAYPVVASSNRVVLYCFFERGKDSRLNLKDLYELKLDLRNAVKDFYDFMDGIGNGKGLREQKAS